MTDVPGWPAAFRGSAAVAAGLVTKNRLRGPHFTRLFPDTYVRTGKEPPDLALRSHAAYRYVEGRGVLSGYSAAEVLDASCGPHDAPAEVTVPGGGLRVRPDLLVHRDRLAPGEMQDVETREHGTLRATTPLRTAWDLARRGGLVDRVVAVDALSRRHGFPPDLLLNFCRHFPGARGNDGVPEVLAYADRRSGSPMESRLRLLLELAGLPRYTKYDIVDEPQTIVGQISRALALPK